MIAQWCFLISVVSSVWGSGITYYFYTKQSLDTPFAVTSSNPRDLASSPHFAPIKETIFLIHGWIDNYTATFNVELKNAILATRDVNVIVVDWSPTAALGYGEAKDGIPATGVAVAEFINDFNSHYGITGDQITLIGYSMGGHVVGIAGRNINSKVKHIIGLDPAGPMYAEADVDRLKPTDGKTVQVIHTNTALFGFGGACGTVDFYPNGGAKQAGCGLDLAGGCSHARPYLYLVEAIHGGVFRGTQCDSFPNYESQVCNGNGQAVISLDPVSATGIFYLHTNTEAPFAQG